MDWADRAVQRAGIETPRTKDPLSGMDIVKEYELIRNEESKLCTRIQQMVIERYNYGR
jgi:hypothetical protein